MICECGHVGGTDVHVSKTQHLNGDEACVVADCDCESFDAVVAAPVEIVDDQAKAIVVAGKSLLDAANALRIADFGWLADHVCEVQRLLNAELVQRIRASKSTAVEAAP